MHHHHRRLATAHGGRLFSTRLFATKHRGHVVYEAPKFRLLNTRHFGTKYSGRVVRETSDRRSVAVRVEATGILPTDVRGYPLPRRDLICKVTKILHSSSDPFPDLSEYLQTLNLTITPSEASEILKCLNHPHLSLEFFRFCSSNIPKFQHNSFTYNRLLVILSKPSALRDSERLDLIRAILDDMERCGVRGSISTINILIGIFGGGADVERCFDLVKKWDLQMNCYTYKCLLQAHLRSNNSNKAFEVYVELRRRGYKLDIFAYNMLLDALAKDNKLTWNLLLVCLQIAELLDCLTVALDNDKIISVEVDQVYMVFKDMKRKHCEPDEYTYTIMIRMTGKIGKADESLTLFQEMTEKGYTPNLIAYNTMIQALANNRMVDKTIFLFSKMVENNCRPNGFTFSVILNVLVAEGQLGRLDEVVEVSNKFMNKSIYAYLVRTLSKLGHASEAHRLLHLQYDWSFHDEGDRDAYMSMLESLCDAGKTTEALDLLSKIHEKRISTDTVMYNTVLSALGKLKKTSDLHDLYEKMKQDGPSPDIFSYNILISSFGRAGRVEEAVKIFEELENSSCKPDIISFNSLINCLGKNGDIDEAHMRFKEMREEGLSPDVVTYSTLIECFGKTDKVEMACRLFDEMLAEGCSPNIVTYNILLDCLERSGRTAEAVDLYAKLKQQGLTPDSITYAVLERLQSGSHQKVRVRRKNPITGWVVSPLSRTIIIRTIIIRIPLRIRMMQFSYPDRLKERQMTFQLLLSKEEQTTLAEHRYPDNLHNASVSQYIRIISMCHPGIIIRIIN
uniref:PROP1-like PPR domain-containing protein n=1 Tax=Vitis vinifera TaxID=29760 RepID=A5CBK8_VITVI|nr:hypothetical protein VITISV_000613 [Vitis vinifera]